MSGTRRRRQPVESIAVWQLRRMRARLKRVEEVQAVQQAIVDRLEHALLGIREPIADVQAQLRRLVDSVSRAFDSTASSRDEALELVAQVQLDLEDLQRRVRALEKLGGVEWDPS